MKTASISTLICFLVCFQSAVSSFENKTGSNEPHENHVSNSTQQYLSFEEEYHDDQPKKKFDENDADDDQNSSPEHLSFEGDYADDNKEDKNKEEDDQPAEDETFFVESINNKNENDERDMINDKEESTLKESISDNDEHDFKATTQIPEQKMYVIDTTTMLENSISTTTPSQIKDTRIIGLHDKHQQIKCSFGDFMVDIQGLFETIHKTECDNIHKSFAIELEKDHFIRFNFTINSMGNKKTYKLNRVQLKIEHGHNVLHIDDHNGILNDPNNLFECISNITDINQQHNFTIAYGETKIIVAIKCSELNDSKVRQSAQNDDSNSGHSFYLVLGSCFAILIIFSVVGFIIKKYCMPRAERYEQVKF